MSKIVLFDLSSIGRCACWSLNPWKTRLALNYKQLDYETQWVDYSDVQSTLKSLISPSSLPSNNASRSPISDGTHTFFTIPTVRFESGEYVMDSKAIATRMEKAHPSPSLHLDSPALKKVEELIPEVFGSLLGVLVPLVPILLSEQSKEYFHQTMKASLGESLKGYVKKNGGEVAWSKALPSIKALGELVKKEGGPFVMGITPSYADFVIVSLLQFFKRVDEAIYKRVVEMVPECGRLYDACQQWLERDDH